MILKQEKRVAFRDFTHLMIANNLTWIHLTWYSLFQTTFCFSRGTPKNSLIHYPLGYPSCFQNDKILSAVQIISVTSVYLIFLFCTNHLLQLEQTIRQEMGGNYNFVNHFMEKSLFVWYISYMYSLKFSFLNVELSNVEKEGTWSHLARYSLFHTTVRSGKVTPRNSMTHYPLGSLSC